MAHVCVCLRDSVSVRGATYTSTMMTMSLGEEAPWMYLLKAEMKLNQFKVLQNHVVGFYSLPLSHLKH